MKDWIAFCGGMVWKLTFIFLILYLLDWFLKTGVGDPITIKWRLDWLFAFLWGVSLMLFPLSWFVND